MNYTLAVIFDFTIIIPALIGCIRFRQIDPAYYPFLYCIWIGLLNEIVGICIAHSGHSNAINNNIYVLFESLLLVWQFKNWGLFRRNIFLFPVLLSGFFLLWILEAFFLKTIHYTISYFRLIYSFVIVLMSIPVFSQQLSQERKNILYNSIFLLCVAFIVYYTYKVITGAFWLYGLHLSTPFVSNIIAILLYINLFSNLIYALAILWMPPKHRFSLPS